MDFVIENLEVIQSSDTIDIELSEPIIETPQYAYNYNDKLIGNTGSVGWTGIYRPMEFNNALEMATPCGCCNRRGITGASMSCDIRDVTGITMPYDIRGVTGDITGTSMPYNIRGVTGDTGEPGFTGPRYYN
jgi:hypothetical protein